MKYRHLMKGPHKIAWQHSFANELGRLATNGVGTNTIMLYIQRSTNSNTPIPKAHNNTHHTNGPNPSMAPVNKNSQHLRTPLAAPALSPEAITCIQQIIGTLLYYARAVDSTTMLVAIGTIAAQQSRGTVSLIMPPLIQMPSFANVQVTCSSNNTATHHSYLNLAHAVATEDIFISAHHPQKA
jgi:hypothetical protein